MADEVIRWEVDNVSSLGRAAIFSTVKTIAGLPWRMSASVERTYRTDNVAYLGVYLQCNEGSESESWNVEHETTIVLVHREEAERNREATIKRAFNGLRWYTEWGMTRFARWEDVLEPEEGFVVGNKMILEARIRVFSVQGLPSTDLLDFSAVDKVTDLILVVEGKQINVSKQFLAIHSPVFKTMFYGDFAEK
ncbi:hypothetical protein PFISCL1PPCAC_20972, partial [Pristionchus fissidentatus]